MINYYLLRNSGKFFIIYYLILMENYEKNIVVLF